MTSLFGLLPCTYKQVFGIACPACGFQRSIVLLVQGNWLESVRRFPPLPVLVCIGLYFLVMLATGRGRNILHQRTPWIILLTTLALNAIYQNLID